jgi:hypothetical protein
MNRMTFLVILQMLLGILITEATPAPFQITLTGLVKNLNGSISQYSVTNLGTSDVMCRNEFYNYNDQSLGNFDDTIGPSGNKKYSLANLGFLQDGFTGYVIISSTQPIEGAVLPGETNPPTPNPMTWANEPTALNQSSILMVATIATDLESPPVIYFFDFVDSPTGGSGGVDSN